MGLPIMHFEIASPNPESAAEFHRQLFDWSVGEGADRWLPAGPDGRGKHRGGLLRTPEGVFPYVDDLRATLEKAEELGGKIVVEPMPIPGVGTFAMFQDPDGVMIGLLEEKVPQTQL